MPGNWSQHGPHRDAFVTAANPYAQPLAELLRIEPAGEDVFRARLPGFGGVTLGCEAVASFAAHSDGCEYQEPASLAVPPAPEELPSEEEIARQEGWELEKSGPIGGTLEWRFVGGTPWRPERARESSIYRDWVRPRTPLPEDPALQARDGRLVASMAQEQWVPFGPSPAGG
jgi:acyl-CoA thioesterase